MVKLLAQSIPDSLHVLDVIEQQLLMRDISHDRPSDDEVIGEMKGAWGHYKLWFRLEEDLGLLIFSCTMDTQVAKPARQKVASLLTEINEKLWLGHFDMTSEDGTIMFRYTMIARDADEVADDQLNTLIDIAKTECDRFYPALQSVLWGNAEVTDAVTLALFDTAGEA